MTDTETPDQTKPPVKNPLLLGDEHYYRQDYKQAFAARVNARRYFAMAAPSIPEQIAEELSRRQKQWTDSTPQSVVIAVLDGGPEYRLEAYKNPPLGVLPEERIEKKASTFYSTCYHRFSLYDLLVIDNKKTREENTYPLHRVFQDACLAVNPAGSIYRTLSATAKIKEDLRDFNDTSNLSWPEQLHARIAIGRTWRSAISSLSLAHRDNVVIEPSLLDGLESVDLILATGVRFGVSEPQ